MNLFPEENYERSEEDVDDDETLIFDSRFESGNLQMAIYIGENEYDLLLQTDVGCDIGRHNQWFYFSVRRGVPGRTYKFNIVNMSKGTSQFSHGMQPVLYTPLLSHWTRTGTHITYTKNTYQNPSSSSTFATLSFCTTVPFANDVAYIAYCYPYTYSMLMKTLLTLKSKDDSRRMLVTELCRSLGGNGVPLLTITNPTTKPTLPNLLSAAAGGIPSKPYLLITSRVHPGETPSSHILHSLLQFLLSADPTAEAIREKVIVKCVPMIAVDGVINGCHRTNLTGVDLNRTYVDPGKESREVWWVRELVRRCKQRSNVSMSLDIHAHSQQKNIFLFGCGSFDDEGLERTFPSYLATHTPFFSLHQSHNATPPQKRSTNRVVFHHDLGIDSFTLEASYCGTDLGGEARQFTVEDYWKVGVGVGRAIGEIVKRMGSDEGHNNTNC
ncbi:hypothetical protein BC832DRAFT_197102 [Gaertneriomyces semiglobifer]|nr:hypothetical protein BC832DRAFT_197102 [Gaertneriomyces semiglobifer]